MATPNQLTLDELAQKFSAKLRFPNSVEVSAKDKCIDGVNNLASAGACDASVWKDPRYRKQFSETKAGVVFVKEFQEDISVAQLVHPHPDVAFVSLIQYLNPSAVAKPAQSTQAFIAGTATVDPAAEVQAGAYIGEGAVVEAGAILHAGSYVGSNAKVGKGTVLHANAVLEAGCVTGKNCILFAGAVVGADGFGYVGEAPGQNPEHPAGRILKVPQIGNVVLGDRVEIGATTTVDRAAFGSTILGNDVKLDCKVQVGHNCEIGACTVISGMTAIAGSAKIGRWCLIGGVVAIKGHTVMTDGVQIAACSVVGRSVREAGQYGGDPIVPIDVWRRNKLKQAREMRR